MTQEWVGAGAIGSGEGGVVTMIAAAVEDSLWWTTAADKRQTSTAVKSGRQQARDKSRWQTMTALTFGFRYIKKLIASVCVCVSECVCVCK
jgi:hypothetical protein